MWRKGVGGDNLCDAIGIRGESWGGGATASGLLQGWDESTGLDLEVERAEGLQLVYLFP